MNAQVEADFNAIGETGHLPHAEPVLPLSGPLANSKPKIMVKCLLAGCGITFLGAGGLAFMALAGSESYSSTRLVFEAAVSGFIATLLGGWFLGALLWIVFGARENAKRSANVAVQHYRDYWQERQRASLALAQGVHSEVVRQDLWDWRIVDDFDSVDLPAMGL
ncbi:hypothetical protein [Luteococcus japonicus]|nr:hypothetical protein [Luteococcus japonicus]